MGKAASSPNFPMSRAANHSDPLNHAPDRSDVGLLLIDVINDLEFDGGEKLLSQALPMAAALASLKRRVKEHTCG